MTKKPPYPLKDGESWAVTSLAQGLKRNGAEVHLLSLCSYDFDQEILKKGVAHIYESVTTLKSNLDIKKSLALRNLLSSKPLHQERYDKIKGEISHKGDVQFDIMLCETLYAYLITRDMLPKLPRVIRAHNLEHHIWHQYADTLSWPKARYFSTQAKRLRKLELSELNSVAGVMWLSATDRKTFEDLGGSALQSLVVAIGFEALESNPMHALAEPTLLGFIGSLDWRPNIDGLNYFLTEIWPKVTQELYDMRLLIAGKNPSKHLAIKDKEDVQFLGEVVDSRSFLEQLHALVVPLRVGSGARVKILEALSLGIPVITSTKGCEGLNLEHGYHLLIADSQASWLEAIAQIKNADLRKRMADNGRAYIRQHHSITHAGALALDFLSSLI